MKRQDEIQVIQIVHGGDPKDCRRCYMSTRPPCLNCGHALSGNIDLRNVTICEFCKTAHVMSDRLEVMK